MAVSNSEPKVVTTTTFHSKLVTAECSKNIYELCCDVMENVLRRHGRKSGDTTPDLYQFIKHVITRAQSHVVTVVVAMMYVERFKRRLPPKAVGDFDTSHRLFLVSVMLASKYLLDQTLTNKAWAKVAAGIFKVQDLNRMELDFLSVITFDLSVNKAMLDDFVQSKVRLYDLRISTELISLKDPLPTASSVVSAVALVTSAPLLALPTAVTV